LYALPILKDLKFDSSAQNFLVQQVQDVGYDQRNAMLGLATFTFLIILYFLRVFISLIMRIFVIIFRGRFYSKEIYEKVS